DLDERGGKFIFQLRSLVNVVTGYQPFSFLFGSDIGTAAGNVAILIFLIALGVIFSRALKRDLTFRARTGPLLLSHLLVSGLLLVFCHRGRSLEMLGHERYFLAVVPGWMLLQTIALEHWASGKWTSAAAGLIGLFQALRFFGPLALANPNDDSSWQASRWLVQNCRKTQCIALVDNFWSYWPIRYYTRDSIAVAAAGHNWKKVAPLALKSGDTIAGCWFEIPQGGGPSTQDLLHLRGDPVNFSGQICQMGTYQ
ncbi:MAG: hypothetical protein AAB425_15270, partial [Bdellovibrionota bacterium]